MLLLGQRWATKSPLGAGGLAGLGRTVERASGKSLGEGRGLAGCQRLKKGLPLLKFVAYR
jgi:hypothetical protein